MNTLAYINQIKDEQFDRLNLARPSALNGNNNRDNHGGSNNIDGMEENEFIPRYSDYYNRKMTLASFNQLPVSIFHRPLASNNFHLSNFGDDLNRKRFYFEPKQINFNPNEPHQMSNQQQSTLPIKEQQAQSYAQSSAINANQHPLKRAIDSIGGANLLKRAVDRIGGGHLLKRR